MVKHITADGVTPIIPGLTNTQGVLTPLISFDCIVDTDFGMILYIDQLTRGLMVDGKKVVNEEFLNSHHTFQSMLYALISRMDVNPLYLCIYDHEFADSLYHKLKYEENYYSKILDMSMETNMMSFLRLVDSIGKEVKPTILCRTKLEAKYVKEDLKLTMIPVVTIGEKFDLDYQQFFIRKVGDEYTEAIKEIAKMDRSIYLARYSFNELDKIIADEFIVSITERFNRIKYVDLYNRKLLQEANTDVQ